MARLPAILPLLCSLLVVRVLASQELFGPAVMVPTGLGPVWVHAVDLDADGNVDLVTADEDGGTLSVLFNEAAGQFARRERYTVGGAPSCIASADLDGDGREDLAVTDWARGRIVLLENLGNGELIVGPSYPARHPTRLVAADVNEDGTADLVYVSGTSFFQIGTGGSGLGLLVEAGGARYQPQELPGLSHGITAAAAADLDADGDVDLAAVGSNQPAYLTLLRSDGQGVFQTTALPLLREWQEYPLDLILADVNRDGAPDVVTAGWSGERHASLAVWPASGPGVFAEADLQRYIGMGNALAACVTDFDGDAWPDVAVLHVERVGREGRGRVDLMRSRQGRDLERVASYAVGPVTTTSGSPSTFRSSLQAADVDNDGDLDLVGTRWASASVFLLHNQRVQGPNRAPVARTESPRRVRVGDEVLLAGTESRDPEGDSLGFHWRQFGGAPVALDGADQAEVRFRAAERPDTLAFELVVQDRQGLRSQPDTVVVPVLPLEYRATDRPPPSSRWERVLTVGAPVSAIAVDPVVPATIYTATSGQGVHKSVDSGNTWQPASTGLADLEVRELLVHPADPQQLYATSGTYRLHHSSNGGSTWVPLESDGWPPYGRRLRFVGQELYLIGRGLARWDHAGVLLRDVSTDLPSDDVGSQVIDSFAADPFDPRIRYALTSPWGTEVDRSLNGLTWDWGAASVPGVRHSPGDLLFVSSATGWVYLGTDNGTLYRSKRLGTEWEEVSEGLPTGLVLRCLAADETAVPGLYLGSDRGVYWSSAGGGAWERLAGGPDTLVTALAVAGSRPRHLFAGTEQGELYRLLLADEGPTAVEGLATSEPPGLTRLLPVFPNPTNGGIVVVYWLETDSRAILDIHNTAGQVVRRLVDAPQAAGPHQVQWDGTGAEGEPLASGVYLMRLAVGRRVLTQSMVRVK